MSSISVARIRNVIAFPPPSINSAALDSTEPKIEPRCSRCCTYKDMQSSTAAAARKDGAENRTNLERSAQKYTRSEDNRDVSTHGFTRDTLGTR